MPKLCEKELRNSSPCEDATISSVVVGTYITESVGEERKHTDGSEPGVNTNDPAATALESGVITHISETCDSISTCIRRVHSDSMYKLRLKVQEELILAVLDTGSQCTILSDRRFEKLQNKPPKIKDVKLHTAGRQLNFPGFIVGPAIVELGTFQVELDHLYVAPIEDDMLLGLDFMRANKVQIDNG